jgi:hypothetical protein
LVACAWQAAGSPDTAENGINPSRSNDSSCFQHLPFQKREPLWHRKETHAKARRRKERNGLNRQGRQERSNRLQKDLLILGELCVLGELDFFAP